MNLFSSSGLKVGRGSGGSKITAIVPTINSIRLSKDIFFLNTYYKFTLKQLAML